MDEKTYYPALARLLNEVGKHLKPKVRCVMELKNLGPGNPDGGLFSGDQFPKKSPEKPLQGQLPSRGAIEVKPAKDDAWTTADSDQVTGYWKKYRQVLVTNYRDFILVGQDAEGKAVKLEVFSLAPDEKSFWATAPRVLDQKVGERFVEFLRRVMLYAAQLAAPEDVAWFLASYAREALRRVEKVKLPALSTVRQALEDALGLKFEGPKGEHFFRSSLVQTLFYGVFSAWVLWAKKNPPNSKKPFDWRLTSSYLRVPMISKLFYLIADPSELENMNLIEVLDRTDQVLNRVERASFFDKFQESHAVQYFYEPFLKAFDPVLRKRLGVWYTPPEIVQYMVERVDRVLRSELNVPLGLADKDVYVLDPCCGTGSYLVEVLNRIHCTLKERGEDALLASDLREAAQKRVFGFEILPAPFVVSHLQLGLLLQNLGAPLPEKPKERVGVYLTNALTGWEPPQGPKRQLAFWEFQEERDGAEHVKRGVPILVILGNPPYDGFAGVSPAEEHGLVEPYKEGLISEWGIKKFNLDDLYVRFFRLAERRIAEMTGRGVVSFISNHSWVREPSFVVLRKHLLNSFDRFWIENMHGDRKITKYAPDGGTSETIFAMPGFSVGIKQGVAISLWVRSGRSDPNTGVLFRNDLDAARAVVRRRELLDTLDDPGFDSRYQRARPDKNNRYSLRPDEIASSYLLWPGLQTLASRQPFAGISEDRRKALISIDPEPLPQRMRMYLDPKKGWADLQALGTCLTDDVPRFDAKLARRKVLAAEAEKRKRSGAAELDEVSLVRYAMRPFDIQWAYYSPVRPLWREPRPEYASAYTGGTPCLVSRFKAAKYPEGPPIAFAKQLCDYHMMPPNASVIPAMLWSAPQDVTSAQIALHPGDARFSANISAHGREYLTKLGIESPDDNPETAGLIWMHALSINYSPAYLCENADGIRQDWPRIPLPDSKELLQASAELGKQVAALLDTESAFDAGAHSGAGSQSIGVFIFTEKRALREKDEKDLKSDLSVMAGWGHAGKDGVTMPGKGRIIERDYTPQEVGAIHESPLLAVRTCDVYLNDAAYWKNIPLRVWEYTIGGYQVIKKWLSYRERKLLGRALTKDEVR